MFLYPFGDRGQAPAIRMSNSKWTVACCTNQKQCIAIWIPFGMKHFRCPSKIHFKWFKSKYLTMIGAFKTISWVRLGWIWPHWIWDVCRNWCWSWTIIPGRTQIWANYDWMWRCGHARKRTRNRWAFTTYNLLYAIYEIGIWWVNTKGWMLCCRISASPVASFRHIAISIKPIAKAVLLNSTRFYCPQIIINLEGDGVMEPIIIYLYNTYVCSPQFNDLFACHIAPERFENLKIGIYVRQYERQTKRSKYPKLRQKGRFCYCERILSSVIFWISKPEVALNHRCPMSIWREETKKMIQQKYEKN